MAAHPRPGGLGMIIREAVDGSRMELGFSEADDGSGSGTRVRLIDIRKLRKGEKWGGTSR